MDWFDVEKARFQTNFGLKGGYFNDLLELQNKDSSYEEPCDGKHALGVAEVSHARFGNGGEDREVPADRD